MALVNKASPPAIRSFLINRKAENCDYARMLMLEILESNIADGPWLAGGSVRRWFELGDVLATDLDIFCRDREQRERVCDVMGELGSEVMVPKGKQYRQFALLEPCQMVIQVTPATFHGPREVLESFPLTVCQFITDGNVILATNEAVTDTKNRRLVETPYGYHVLNKEIYDKYKSYGFAPCPEIDAKYDSLVDRSTISGG